MHLLRKLLPIVNTKEELKNLIASLSEIRETDRLISTLLDPYLVPPQELISNSILYYEKLEKQKSDPVAVLVMQLIRKQRQRRYKILTSLILPQRNRLQQVSLDEYEAVKKLWYDIYIKGDIPLNDEGEQQSREDWIKSNKEELDNILNLFSSDDPANTKKAMEKIIDILPFLLIGGFSKDEMLGYLKAKKEAAEMALLVLNEKKEEVVMLRSNHKDITQNRLQHDIEQEEEK